MALPDNTDLATIDSPLGPITLEANSHHLLALTIHRDDEKVSLRPQTHNAILALTTAQLAEYFEGTRTTFDIPLSPKGTPFQEAIWRCLRDISWGHTDTYRGLGESAGYPNASRAVGGAVGANPIPIVIPCHRIVGASGAITGYSGGNGISTKQTLLRHEGIAFRH